MSKLGKVRLLKSIHIDGEFVTIWKTQLWDCKEGRYVNRDEVNPEETVDFQGNLGAKRYSEQFDHYDETVGQWIHAGTVCEVVYLTTKGVRIRTEFDTPNKVVYVHHDNFRWVEYPEGSEKWAVLPSELY